MRSAPALGAQASLFTSFRVCHEGYLKFFDESGPPPDRDRMTGIDPKAAFQGVRF
jgi:hypothetical protein